ncbi:glycosyl hydrolase family 8 [uncultured Alsobacter sp.]|uniref:glycosyl hydrolase family 8 n=1 Tax=uncultured Alsobacter sp. TaxID=1748258 RepID=UPI0025E6EE5D|nr:glycosyl hydrolase family 8 [uncultured Alsobacter sp.]
MRVLAAAAAGLLAVHALGPAVGQTLPAAPGPSQAAQGPVAGRLAGQPGWAAWRDRFVTPQGRVVDTGNGGISHSEGQGYGMLLAVAAGDRPTFDRIWGWTRANLMVREDALMAWRWEPEKRPAVADMNAASDGDILVAWALTEAGEAWSDEALQIAARRSAVEIGRKLIVLKGEHAPFLLPGPAGFSAADRSDGPLTNPSYLIFPAFERLPIAAPEVDWAGLSRSGLALLRKAGANRAGVPADWIALRTATPVPAAGLDPVFGYNGIRIVLHLAWAAAGTPESFASALRLWGGGDRAPVLVDVASGAVTATLDEPGYRILPALAACAATGAPLPAAARMPVANQNYYPATLHLLGLVAVAARHPECLR